MWGRRIPRSFVSFVLSLMTANIHDRSQESQCRSMYPTMTDVKRSILQCISMLLSFVHCAMHEHAFIVRFSRSVRSVSVWTKSSNLSESKRDFSHEFPREKSIERNPKHVLYVINVSQLFRSVCGSDKQSKVHRCQLTSEERRRKEERETIKKIIKIYVTLNLVVTALVITRA
jgi:hypothetical protein